MICTISNFISGADCSVMSFYQKQTLTPSHLSLKQQCFFARLGFTQPPACLKCAYKSSGCGSNAKKKETITAMTTSNIKCNELVPWRIDANIPLHPDKLEGNVVFITCDTARSLVNGDAYPSVRWDTKKKRLIISDRRQTL